MRRPGTARPRVGTVLLVAALWAAPSAAQVCGTFERVPTPSPHATTNALQSVAAATAADTWALGTSGNAPLLLHWDGAVWATRPLPAGPAGATYTTLGSTPDGDVWLGGEGPPPIVGMPGKPVLARARAGTFDRVDEVTLAPQTTYPHWQRGGMPMDIDGTSATDVWVALEANGNGDATANIIPVALHFDGAAWTETQLPRPTNRRSHPRGVEAIAPDDVWMVGYGRSTGAPFFGEIYHYDGTAWSYVSTPLTDTPEVFFLDVSASAPDDVWVVGYINYTEPVYLHWDGAAWTVVAGPTAAAPVRVAAIAPDEAWALPYVLHESNARMHWDGAAWTEVPAPIDGASAVRRTALARVGTCDVWTVGHYVVDGVSRTLAERLTFAVGTSAPPAADDVSLTVAPSPTRARTAVRYALTGDGPVRLDVVDALGRVVAVLTDGPQRAGAHEASWDASAQPAGVYRVRLQTARDVLTRAVSVVR